MQVQQELLHRKNIFLCEHKGFHIVANAWNAHNL